MERVDLGLLAFPLVVITLLALGIIASDPRAWDSALSLRKGPSDELAFLILNLVLYSILRHKQVRRLRGRLLRERIRAETLARRYEELQQIREISSEAHRTDDPATTIRRIARNALRCADADFASLYLVRGVEGRLEPATAAAASGAVPSRDSLPAGQGIAGAVVASARPLFVHGREAVTEKACEGEALAGMESVLAVPLFAGHRVLGALTVAKVRPSEESFSFADLHLAVIFADHAAWVLQSSTMREELVGHGRELHRLSEDLRRARRFFEGRAVPSSPAQIASRLGHDLASPLTSIQGYAQLLLAQPLEAKPRTWAETILSETRRCHEIADSAIALLQADRTSFGPCDLGQVVEAALAQRSEALGAAGIRVVRELPSDLPSIVGNPDLLEEGLLQLLRNAEAAMEGVDGDRILEIAAHRRDGAVRLLLSDTGSGIPPDLAERVFEPFFSTRPEGTASGLGLTVAAKIFGEHGATLRHEPNRPHGARFVIDFAQTWQPDPSPATVGRIEAPPPPRDRTPAPAPASLDNAEPTLLQSKGRPRALD